MPTVPIRIARMFLAWVMPIFLFTPSVLAGSQYKVLHAFGNGRDGGGLWTSVTLDKQGRLYGATSGGGVFGQGIVFRLTPVKGGSWREDILHSFPSFPNDGQGPNGALVQDNRGNWYGTTKGGGYSDSGTVFEMRQRPRRWGESVLYKFGTQHGDEGGSTAGLVMDAAGNLYGTTPTTVFELSRSLHPSTWTETILHRFLRKGDGGGAYAGVILDPQGNLYGTTGGGGIGCGGEGCGTVYEVKRTSHGWQEKILHYFNNDGKDGVTPGNGALFLDDAGNFYGTTEVGGSSGGGAVFELKRGADGHWQETILYDFRSVGDGVFPAGGVVMDKAGSLYGTTAYGGSGCGCGVVYKLAPAGNGKWNYTILHKFNGFDGVQPTANLIFDDRGNLYGTTATGGQYGAGVVFELTP